MNEIDAAIMTKLKAGSGLTALITTGPDGTAAVYSWQAPDGSDYPFVIFNDMSDVESNETTHQIHDIVYLVKALSTDSMKKAKAIDYQARLLLHNVTLSISNFTPLKLKRESSIRYVENQSTTQKVYHAGGLYRLVAERTA